MLMMRMDECNLGDSSACGIIVVDLNLVVVVLLLKELVNTMREEQ